MKIGLNQFLYTGLAGLLMLLSACDEENESSYGSEPEQDQIQIRQDVTFGNILADEGGSTLYFFARDIDGNSTCEGGCLDNWPVFYKPSLEAGNGLNQGDLGVITRPDGSQQNTFKGWPLYYFIGDSQVGDINGEGLGNVWFVAKPDYDVMIAAKEVDGNEEKYLVNSKGRSIYFFTVDDPNQSNCEGGCLDNWPPVGFEIDKAPSAIDASKFGTIVGNSGQNQATFDARPLYYFAQDVNRGELTGQGVGGSWFILNEDLIAN